MKDKIRKYAYSSPISVAIVAALFSVVIFSLPDLFNLSEQAAFYAHVICRAVAALLALYFAKSCKFKFLKSKKISVSEIFILILGFLVCVNNFPFIGFLTGRVKLFEDAKIVRYVFYCAAIGISEEFVFRGLVMPLVGLKLRNRRRAPFLTVAVSSSVFALCHAFNVISFGIGPTLLQVGYTFLTGGLFGAAYLITENIIFPIILHVVFDLGGLVFAETFGIACGNMWDIATVIITAVLAVVATVVYVLKLYSYGSDYKNQK